MKLTEGGCLNHEELDFFKVTFGLKTKFDHKSKCFLELSHAFSFFSKVMLGLTRQAFGVSWWCVYLHMMFSS